MDIYEKPNAEPGVEFLESNESNDTLYPTYHIAISPNGQQVATFNTLTLELNICRVDSLSEVRQVKCEAFKDIGSSSKLVWSLAISNPIESKQIDSGVMYAETLIALSCFDEKHLMLGYSQTASTITHHSHADTSSYDDSLVGSSLINNKIYNSLDEEKAGESIKDTMSATWIISTWHEARILTSIDDLGGLVRFLSDDPLLPNTATILVINVDGISKTSFNLDNITMLKKDSTYNDNTLSWWNMLPFFPQSNLKEEFFFPLKIQAELKKLYQNTPCLDLLTRSMENDYFMIEDYKDRVQFVEMYNLRTNKLEMVFHQRSESATTTFGHGSPAIAISRHKALMAYCRGANSITIYLMENSLEISTQRFPRIERILSLDFINGDESLLIIAKEREDSIPLIIIWDLFSYLDNAIRVIQDAKKLFTSQHYRLVRSCGNILLVDNSDGSVLSVLDHPLIKDMLVPTRKSKQPELFQLPLQKLGDSEWDQAVYHTIFYQNGKHYDVESHEKKFIIVNDKEPWIHNKNYNRISAFLDDERTTQLFIGETSVQVWYRKGDEDSKKKLKYIWVSPTNRKLSVKSLEIGQREFKITLSSKSIQSYNEENIVNIHWPFHVNAVNDACSALHHLYKRRDEPAGPKKQQQYENLVNRTEKMVRQFIKKRPAVWRLIDVRYNVMTNLIHGRRVHLVQQILNKNESDFSMKYLHIPRLYEWPRKPKDSDLEIAIKCTEGRRQRDSILVGFLLDYYSENAMDNTGWMFTVSRAIPLLFEYHLDTYAKDLFSKPVFGTKEIHLDESHINPEDLPRGKLRYIKAFNQSTELVPKHQQSIRDHEALQPILNIIDKSKTSFSHNQQLAALQKVIPGLDRGDTSALIALRLVPLPDFTVYPEGTKNRMEVDIRELPFQILRILIWPRGYAIKKESKLSPFIRVIRKDRDGVVLDNPAMEAVIDFKWESARNHFLRHIFLFSTFAILFAVLTGAVKNSFVSVENNGVNRDGNTIISIMTTLFYYLGYYLLASEIVQFHHEGWRRYISVYNFFDLASIIMPLATYSVILIRESSGNGYIPVNQLKQLTIATSFTILVLWIETFLLLRYFAVTGNFIYIIINIVRNVWPFIAFMGIVIFAHGHAMYLLLRNPNLIGLTPQGSEFHVEDQNGKYLDPNQSIVQTFNISTTTDNYFSDFAHSVAAVYFWINGRWDQLDQWDFWPVTVLSFVASVLLIIIMQNMLIAFMTGVFDEAKSEGRLAVLKYRAELIAEYETLEKLFGDPKGNPRHIFYIGNINKFSKWLRKCEHYWKLRALSTKEKHEYNKYYDVKDDDDSDDEMTGSSKEWDITGLDVDSYEQKNISLMNRKSRMEFYSSWSVDDSIINNEKRSANDGSSKETKKVLFEETSNDELTRSPSGRISPIIEDANNIHEEIVSLKSSVKNVEDSIDDRLNLLDGKLMEMMDLLNKLANSNNINTGNVGNVS